LQDILTGTGAEEQAKEPVRSRDQPSKQQILYNVTENELMVHELLLVGELQGNKDVDILSSIEPFCKDNYTSGTA
jgi:hypothetical protein